MKRFTITLTGLILPAVVAFIVLIGVDQSYGEHIWHNYNGHQYALTLNHNDWLSSESEAVGLGGHLATINDDAENQWLTETFAHAYTKDHPGETWHNIAWIGYYLDEDQWKWISGEPVTYYRHDYFLWPQDGTHAYLHLADHPHPFTWNAEPYHDGIPGFMALGIVEVAPLPGPGDANGDGNVDVSDLGILATHYDTGGGLGWGDGDFNGDGAVDVIDLGVLATHFDSGPSVVASIPEPGTITLLLFALTSLLCFRRRK